MGQGDGLSRVRYLLRRLGARVRANNCRRRGAEVSNDELLKALQEAGIVKVIPVGSYEEKGEKSE
jgi:hypothetical protein